MMRVKLLARSQLGAAALLRSSPRFASTALRESAVPREKTWGKQPLGHTFNPDFATEVRQSQIPGAANGWWALVDIPAGVRLRRVCVADGSLVSFDSLDKLEATGWDLDECVHYGIGHHKDPSSVFFLNPGTAMNHSDRTRETAIKYVHDEKGVLELWTVKDIQAGEEMFNDYGADFGKCPWYDEMQFSRGNVPLSHLAETIEAMYK